MAKKPDIRKLAKRSRSGPIRRLDKGETAEVRFLFEMDDWGALFGHYDETTKRSSYYESEDDLPVGASPRDSFFTVCYDVVNKSVDVWELRKTLVSDLVECEVEYGTVTDRNYKLKRRGEDLKTKYSAVPCDKSPMGKKMKEARAKAEEEGVLAKVLDTMLSVSDDS